MKPQKEPVDPLIDADEWSISVFDKVANGEAVHFTVPERTAHNLRFRWYRFKKKYLLRHPGERSPQANYIRSSSATIDPEPTGYHTLRIGQLDCLVEYNKQVAAHFMNEMAPPLITPRETFEPPPVVYKPHVAGPSKTYEAQGLHPDMSPAEFAEFNRTKHLYNLGMCTGCGEPQGLPHSVNCSHFASGELNRGG